MNIKRETKLLVFKRHYIYICIYVYESVIILMLIGSIGDTATINSRLLIRINVSASFCGMELTECIRFSCLGCG